MTDIPELHTNPWDEKPPQPEQQEQQPEQQEPFSFDQVSRAANDGADLVTGGLDLGDRDRDLINIVVNAILSLLKNPAMTLDDVLNENWQADGDDETAAEMVRSWWDW